MRDMALRQQKDRLLGPIAAQGFASIEPNVVSLFALLIGLLSVGAIIHQFYWAGLGLWLLNRLFDGLDGLVARMHGKQSDFGGYLDLCLDFLIYIAIPVAFICEMPTAANLWMGLALFAAYYLNTITWTALGPLLEKRNLSSSNRLTSLEMPVGLIEGAETIFFYSLFYLLPAYTAQLFGLMAILVCLTAGQRIWWAYRHLEESGSKE